MLYFGTSKDAYKKTPRKDRKKERTEEKKIYMRIQEHGGTRDK
jgi:hypothetical protein